MSSAAQSLKMQESAPGRNRGVFWAIVLSVIVTFFASNWLIIKLAYTYGGINLNPWHFTGGPNAAFEYVTAHINHPAGANAAGWFCRILGAVLMGILTIMHYRFLWWPLHPIGFTIGSVWLIDRLWFSIFLAWLLKTLVLKYAGADTYHRGRPFFLGLILGQYSAACFWFIIDFFTGHTGNVVFWI